MMDIEEVKSKLKEIILPIIEDSGAYLVDINLKGVGRRLIVEILVDTDDGITVKKCEEISRRISDALDFQDPIPGSYRLEVSSPGVGNPFKVKRQYFTNVGRFLRVRYIDDILKREREVLGRLVSAGEETIELEVDDELIVLRYEQILEAKTEVVW